MSKHVITIGAERSKRVAEIIKDKSDQAGRELNKSKTSLEERENPLKPHYQEYWNIRIDELEHELNELQALSTIFGGAESITITHEVKEQGND